MQRTAVLNVVGLTRGLIGPQTPCLATLLRTRHSAEIVPALPAVTCTAQSNYLTGQPPAVHGIVANGWYNRELAEVHFWKQSNRLVEAPKIWDHLKARNQGFTCAQLFWWYNMYTTADWSITPRPMYPADGRKFFDIHSWPQPIRPEIKRDLGEFPFAGFWGPAAGVKSPQGGPDAATRWIAEAARWIEKKYRPTLSLIYLPHLDYNLQRYGTLAPGSTRREPRSEIYRDLERIDAVAGELVDFFENQGVQVIVLSEYGITTVDTPIHLNRRFRERGWLTIKEELGLELLDAGNSRAFAVADHQIAHVYVNDRSLLSDVRSLLESTPGVAKVLDASAQRDRSLFHARSGDFLVVSEENAWFTYYYWHDDTRAPDFARCVDIHRKPGYDPVELFLDPAIPWVRARIAARLLQKKLGFRMLMDVIPLDAGLVKGSHGCHPANRSDWPLIVSPRPLPGPCVESTAVCGILEEAVESRPNVVLPSAKNLS
ncbi:MAG: alkaline phosphatase family protein [Pedosphaera sp.]|nr:alkaline phosphatase family protein [Pedosphaera sp.]